jgi:hypothetical protein
MRLAHFESKDYVAPVVSGLERPTKTFMKGVEGVEWIDMNPAGTLVQVRRSRLPDLYFMSMGFGTHEGDASPVPGNRSGNPVEDRKGKR